MTTRYTRFYHLVAVSTVAAASLAIPTWATRSAPAAPKTPVSVTAPAAATPTPVPVAPVVQNAFPVAPVHLGLYDVKYITSFTLAEDHRNGWECYNLGRTPYQLRSNYVCVRPKVAP